MKAMQWISKRMRRGTARAGLVLLLAGLAGSEGAQVPQDTTFRGRLVDGAGTPRPGPVGIELRVFDAETAGTQLYSEEHLATPLDVTGAFSVQLGAGTSPSCSSRDRMNASIGLVTQSIPRTSGISRSQRITSKDSSRAWTPCDARPIS